MTKTALYDVLGIDAAATPDQIKRAWHRMSKKHHPDKNGSTSGAEEKIKQINAAYEVLSNPQKRAYYDQHGDVPPDVAQPSENADLYGLLQKAMQAAMQAGDVTSFDLIQTMRDIITRETQSLNVQKAEAEGKLALMTDLRSRIERKDGENILVKILQPQIDSIENSIRIMTYATEVGAKAIVLLKDYKYRFTKRRGYQDQPFPQTFMYTAP